MRRGSKQGQLKNLMVDSDKPFRNTSQLLLERPVHQHTRARGNGKVLINTLAKIYPLGEDK
ncbi:hypothetical protein HPB50_018140 [Hyalomma asiaticum]|uniref:Uncharacterized protein n=1 Tax=Hyalomma asiaticum TaxID=266040 RepID=A0ACB7RX97_HYAAI|nr:hypothetical protein HPB50_018140 [Hyalomma asiaticum]